MQPRYHSPQEEIALGPACWLWDYLCRSGAAGYLLPLSGGADSSAVAAIVGCMCQLVVKAVSEGNEQVCKDATRIGGYEDGQLPTDAKDFANCVLHTVYLGTENSSAATQKRAADLAEQIGASHMGFMIDTVVSAIVNLFEAVTGKRPKYKVHGGSQTENLALQNIQARLRMVIAYLMAQLLPWLRGKSGYLLVLGSANVDEGLRGYLTKYDCSSADINPIGGISKHDLKAFLKWGGENLGYPVLMEVEAAAPTAELEPTSETYVQSDEIDMGMTYEELSMYGRLRKIFRCGPVSMFQHLCHRWHGRLVPAEVAKKVKDFFYYYSVNRHKMTTITPAYHAENYSVDDNRFDLRQFLYNTQWPWQFHQIDEMVVASKDRRVDEVSCKDPNGGQTIAEQAGDLAQSQGVPSAAAGQPHSGAEHAS